MPLLHIQTTWNYYLMTVMDGNITWMKITHLLSFFPLNLMAPFCESTFTLIIFNSLFFKCTH